MYSSEKIVRVISLFKRFKYGDCDKSDKPRSERWPTPNERHLKGAIESDPRQSTRDFVEKPCVMLKRLQTSRMTWEILQQVILDSTWDFTWDLIKQSHHLHVFSPENPNHSFFNLVNAGEEKWVLHVERKRKNTVRMTNR